ncbi:MAG: hypothetical protein FWE50_01450 [Alphaproteobacteria bacterium]|nr:hypothetical protein [Alphaproteobacteria bacterium]
MKKTLVTSLAALVTVGVVSGAKAAGIPPVVVTPDPTTTMSYYTLGDPNDDKGGMGLPVAEERFRNAIGWTNELKTNNKAIVPAINELVDTISDFTPPTGGIATEVNSDNEIDLLYVSDHLNVTVGNELDVKVNGTITSDTTIGGGGSIVTGKTVYDYIKNYTQTPLTARDGILIDGSDSDQIWAVGDSDRAVTVTSDGIGVVVDNSTVVINNGKLTAIAASNPIFEDDGINVYWGAGSDSDKQYVRAVGDIDKAVEVTSDGIGVIVKSDGAISAASDGLAVKVDGSTVIINSDGNLESTGGIPPPGSDCYIAGVNYCVLSYDTAASDWVWNKMI